VNNNCAQSVIYRGFRALLALLIIANLSACVSTNKSVFEPNDWPSLVCNNAAQYEHQTIGDGQCVSLIKLCANAPQTQFWTPGARVLNTDLPEGTVIATFDNDRYPNKSGYHAAIYIQQDQQGLWVWDQWIGKPVHKRLIRIRNDDAAPGNTAQAYRVVETNKRIDPK
jgi:hypothetical protein